MSLTETIQEELVYKTAFTIPGINLAIPVSVVTTWAIMGILVVIAILLTRNLQIVPGKRQMFAEWLVRIARRLFGQYLGKDCDRYSPYIGTVFLYLIIANMLGLFGFAPPTKDLNTTVGLALMSIVLVQYAGIHRKGVGGWLKSFAQPMAIMTPMNILELIIKPLSLCMRLFGNVLGAFIIMEMIKFAVPAVVPLAASAYFDIFDGILQAYVFSFLTSLYIMEAVE